MNTYHFHHLGLMLSTQPITRYHLLAQSIEQLPNNNVVWVLPDPEHCAISIGFAFLKPDKILLSLQKVIEHFLQHEVVKTAGLLRRPALQLVVIHERDSDAIKRALAMPASCIPDEKTASDKHEWEFHVEGISRHLESWVGSSLPDFRVILVGADGINDILNFHGHFLNLLKNEKKVSLTIANSLSAFRDKWKSIAERLEQLKKSDSSGHDIPRNSWVELQSSLREGFPTLGDSSSLEKESGLYDDSYHFFPTHINLNARHWNGHTPLDIPLSHFNFIAADNAAGKTNLAEIVSIVAGSLPRTRIPVPEGSLGISGTVKIHGIHVGILNNAQDRQSKKFSSPDLLPLFSDDTDFNGRENQNLGVLILWLIGDQDSLQHLRDIVKYQEDSNRTLQELLNQIKIADPPEAVPLNSEEQAWLQSHDDTANAPQRLNDLMAEANARITSLDQTIDRWVRDALGIDGERALDSLVEQVDRYLQHTVVPQEKRSNTAALVRKAIAQRIGYGLMLNQKVPWLIIDEPTLGQHATAAARTMARFSRLWRMLEQSSTHQSPAKPMVLFDKLNVVTINKDDESEGSVASHLLFERVPSVLLPPTMLILSYDVAALESVAALEGEPLDERTIKLLKELIPPTWRGAARKAVERVLRKLHEQPENKQVWWPPELVAIEFGEGAELWIELRKQWLNEKYKKWPSDLQAAEEERTAMLGWDVEKPLRALGLGDLVPQAGLKLLVDGRKLLRWLGLTGLVVVALGESGKSKGHTPDLDRSFLISTVNHRRITMHGGMAGYEGVRRIRRLNPNSLHLPDDPKGTWPKQDPQNNENPTIPSQTDSPTSISDPTKNSPDVPLVMVGRRWRVESSKASLPLVIEEAGEPLSEEASGIVKIALQGSGWPDAEFKKTSESAHITITTQMDGYGETSFILSMNVTGGLYQDSSWERQARTTKQLERIVQAGVWEWLRRRPVSERFFVGVVAEYNWQGTTPDLMFQIPPPSVMPHTEESIKFLQGFQQNTTQLHNMIIRVMAPPSIAVLLGWNFRRFGGFPPNYAYTDQEVWSFRGTLDTEPFRTPDIQRMSGASETHLVVMITPNAAISLYDQWRNDNPEFQQATRIIINEPVRLPDGENARAWANGMLQVVAAERAEKKRVRMFLAMPNALAFVLGSSMNSMGEVVVMDYDRESKSYKEGARFTT